MSVLEVISLTVIGIVAIICGTAIAIFRMALDDKQFNKEEDE